jgi:hypothetical protein
MDSCQAFYCTNGKEKCEKNFFFVITGQDYPSSVNRQTSGESASLPQYDEGTESAEVATSASSVLR